MPEAAVRHRHLFSPAQCRAARALLRLTRDELAQQTGIAAISLELYETGGQSLTPDALAALGAAFARRGVIALRERRAGEGVRFAAPRTPFASAEASRVG